MIDKDGVHPNIVFILALALVIVNSITSGQAQSFWTLIWEGKKGAQELTSNTGLLLGEIIFVFIVGFMAETNDDVSNVLTALIIGLWLVWAMSNGQTLGKWTSYLTGNTTGGTK